MPKELDLALWLDQSVFIRQNQLKADFLQLFEQVGNSFSNEELTAFYSNSRGKKISKGNQLAGFPYLVLDLIRNFDLQAGCNIRLVSWFGHGLYCFLFFGERKRYPDTFFLTAGFKWGDPKNPWDVASQVALLEKSSSTSTMEEHEGAVWVKKIPIPADWAMGVQVLNEEVTKILRIKHNQRIKC